MTWLDELKIEDLRGDYAELAAVIGLELTVKFAEDWYGGPLLLPTVTEITHPGQLKSGYLDLFPVIGLEMCDRVAQQCGGGQLYLPQGRHALQAAKERYVKDHDLVNNRRKLARDTGLSLRQVYRLCTEKTKKHRDRRRHAVDPDQLSLLPVSD